MISFGRQRRPETGVPAIKTARLRLVAMSPATVQAEDKGSAALGQSLGAPVSGDWPPQHWEPHVRMHILAQLSAHPETTGWHRYMLLDGRPQVLIGSLGAFPCAAGDVEMGYSVVDSQQRRGYGTEAAQAHVSWLLLQPAVHSVSAQTYTTMPQSIKIMERCGMRLVGPGDDPGTVRYRRWR